MASMVETMFYTGEKPWHQDTQVYLEDAPTSEDAIRMSGLDWAVDSKAIYDEHGNIINGYKRNVRSTDNQTLGVVSDRYQIVQNQEAFAFTDFLLGEGVKYETAGSLAGGKRVWMLAKMETSKILGDDITPYLVFSNSHDGKGAINVSMVNTRVVCQNTLTLALSTAKRIWSTKHIGDIQGKLKEAEQTLFLANQYNQQLEETAEILVQQIVSPADFQDFINNVFPISDKLSERQADNIKYSQNALSELYFNKDDIKKFNGTAWGVVNAVADYMPHIKPKRQTQTYKENNFMKIVDNSDLMKKTCEFFKVA